MVRVGDSFREVIGLFVDFQKIFEAAIVLFVLFAACTLFVSADIYAVYKDLLPFQGLWQSLNIVDQLRLIALPLFSVLTVWYFWGAFVSKQTVRLI